MAPEPLSRSRQISPKAPKPDVSRTRIESSPRRPQDWTTEILQLLQNHAHRAQSSDHRDVDATVILTTRDLLVVTAPEALRGVGVQHPNGRNRGRLVHPHLEAGAGVLRQNARGRGRHVVRRIERSLPGLRRNVEVGRQVRERGMMWAWDRVDGKAMVSRKRGDRRGEHPCLRLQR